MSSEVLAIHTRLFAAWLAIAFFLTSASAQETNDIPDTVVTVRGFKGSPSALKGNRWHAVQVGEVLPPGAVVRTGPNDSLDVQLDEVGRVISFAASSQATIDLRNSLVVLESGDVVASIRRTRKQNTSVILRAPFGVCTVRAADFRVAVNPLPAVFVLDGVVEFLPARANAPGTVLLREGTILLANIDTPSLGSLDPKSRSFLTGRIDSLVTFHGAAVEKFRTRSNLTACHTPPLPKYADPEATPGRAQGFVSVLEDTKTRFAPLVEETPQGIRYPTGSPGCPVHSRLTSERKERPEAPAKRPWEK